MNEKQQDDNTYPPPPYIVNSFYFSIHDDDNDSQFEIRRYGKCFFINLTPENFASSPELKQQYLDYLLAEKADVDEYNGESLNYDPESFQDWALDPFMPLFEQLAPKPEHSTKTTLHDYLHPEVHHYSLHAIDGVLMPVHNSGEHSRLRLPGLDPDASLFSSTIPTYLPSEIELCITHPEDHVFVSPNRVLINTDTNALNLKKTCYFKFFHSGEENTAHELSVYKKILESTLDPSLRIVRLVGYVKNDENQFIGLLLTYIDCKPNSDTLTHAVKSETLPTTRKKWVDQVTATLSQLHEAGIIWGDAKTDHVLIDKNGDAWIIGFGGGYTKGWVEKEKARTKDGDLQGLNRIVGFVLTGERKPDRTVEVHLYHGGVVDVDVDGVVG